MFSEAYRALGTFRLRVGVSRFGLSACVDLLEALGSLFGRAGLLVSLRGLGCPSSPHLQRL